MALKLIKICRVSPAPDSSNDSVDPLVLPLTFFDLRWVRSHPTQQAIFYKLSESSSREFFHSVILPKLELSLSLVLRHYLPFAGLRPQTELRVLVPELSVTRLDSASLYSLQITLFQNQGFCIGLAEHHVLKDGTGSIMFIKSWAHIYRTLINVPPGLESKILEFMSYFSDGKYGKRTMKPPPSTEDTRTDLVRITLELTREKVEKLKAQAKRESTRSQPELHLSSR
ncbi:hypothetical protein EUTSA_v10005681mg, partial [Eutrema salsugineum]